MLRIFVLATILLTGVDHWTTYLCLHAPIDGWTVTEANPIAQWLFEWTGLAAGLALDSAVTLVAILFLAKTHVFEHWTKLGLLGAITCSTGYAVLNNLAAISRMGLAPWSGVA